MNVMVQTVPPMFSSCPSYPPAMFSFSFSSHPADSPPLSISCLCFTLFLLVLPRSKYQNAQLQRGFSCSFVWRRPSKRNSTTRDADMAITLEASLEASLWTLTQLHATLAVSESDARPQCRCTHSLQSSVDTPDAVARAELPRRSDTCPSELNRGTSRSLHTASADPSFPVTTASAAAECACLEQRLQSRLISRYFNKPFAYARVCSPVGIIILPGTLSDGVVYRQIS